MENFFDQLLDEGKQHLMDNVKSLEGNWNPQRSRRLVLRMSNR
ncbi:MAG: hypothetical protein ACJ707_08295 [Nitrososphaera sp.]